MYIADLHIHSRYSRATSRECTPVSLDMWARRKGIHLAGTGDFTHPEWRKELKECLKPAEDGLYVLKEDQAVKDNITPDLFAPRFVVTGEISTIYKKNGKVRKVHSLIILPGLEQAEKVSAKLENIGNLHSDGRPILGLDCRDLAEIILDICPEAVYVPAHIWTPHFSLFGAFSGFDTLEECFEDMSPYIHALETGLSSDPPMNWRISALDRYQLISNSDAHSPAKLGREASILDCEMSYSGLERALQTGEGLYGTIEFFPEEGKYHFDGHRKCGLCIKPSETEKYGGICPVCGRRITIGVFHRVEELADREEGYVPENPPVFESLMPLEEVIGSAMGKTPASRSVERKYMEMIERLGPEFHILRTVPEEDIERHFGNLIAEGIRRLRNGRVELVPGFDGEYGKVKLFKPYELQALDGQTDFFSLIGDVSAEEKEEAAAVPEKQKETGKEEKRREFVLNREQQEAVASISRYTAVIAGPGTGKTATLAARVLYLMETRRVKPSEITAVTFTNRAASELRERIGRELGKRASLGNMTVGTFHSICMELMRKSKVKFFLADEEEALEIAAEASQRTGTGIDPHRLRSLVSYVKSQDRIGDESMWEAFDEKGEALKVAGAEYSRIMEERGLWDFDDILINTLMLMEEGALSAGSFSYLLVDEFQDINPLQYRLIKMWNRKGRELFLIGDPDQSIYGFRGSDPQCFKKAAEDFKEMKIIRLRENYRSTPSVINAALKVINGNPGEERALNASCEKEDCPVRLVKAAGHMGEAIFTAKEINAMAGGIGMLDAQHVMESRDRKKVRSFDDIAVLCRTRRQGELVEKCLRQEGIPYIAAGREAFLRHEKVKGTIAFMEYLDDPENLHAMKRALSFIWGLEDSPASRRVIDEASDRYASVFRRKRADKFMEMWMKETDSEKTEEMIRLRNMAVFYESCGAFLKELLTGVESDLRRAGGRDIKAGAVRIMTLHGAKGLEFPAVIIPGVREGLIPLKREGSAVDTAEERRLFYVGMTRAEEELILVSGGEESEFVSDIKDGLLTREKAPGGKKPPQGEQMSFL